MRNTTNSKQLSTHFFAPANAAFLNAEHRRNYPELSDSQWIQIGVSRVLKECRSDRGFLRDWAMSNNEEAVVDVGLFLKRLIVSDVWL
jgi:hypothetical protein